MKDPIEIEGMLKEAIEVYRKVAPPPEIGETTFNYILASFTSGAEISAAGLAPKMAGLVQSQEPEDAELKGVGEKAKHWLRRADVSAAQIEQLFYYDGESFTYIENDVPGASKKEKTQNAYILAGVLAYLNTDAPHFEDESARQICVRCSCLSPSNHSSYIKDIGKHTAGSKKKGWNLTGPGEARAIALINELAPSEGTEA